MLLEKRAKVDLQRFDGYTALILASMQGHEAIVNLLLENEAEVNLQDKKGGTALFRASKNGRTAVVKTLLKKGAHINLKSYGVTATNIFWRLEGREAAEKMRQEEAARPDHQKKDGVTPLMAASFWGFEAVVKILLDYGADVRPKLSNGVTALSMAKTKGIAQLLKAAGAK